MDLQKLITQKFGSDKILHFLAGGWIGMLPVFIHLKYAWLLSLPLAFLIGVLKEVYDLIVRKTGFDLRDVIATSLGGIVSGIIIYILN